MTLTLLSINNLRNLSHLEFAPSPGVNFFCGANGAGKTSILEAVAFLGLGRSFKGRKHRQIIQHGQDSLTVFGKLEGVDVSVLGVQRSADARENRTIADGKPVKRTSYLAESLPVLWVDAQALNLLSGAPSLRRSFIDWLLFHVKHEFRLAFQNYALALKQRNALLRRDKIDGFELQVWTETLANEGEVLNDLRRQYIGDIERDLSNSGFLERFLSPAGIEIKYFPGWDLKTSLLESLEAHLVLDKSRGFTGSGPHRADVSFRSGKVDLGQTLSRGQTKSLVYALYLAQIEAVKRLVNKSTILLLDDFPAELDAENRNQIAKMVEALGIQVFVTGIEKIALIGDWSAEMLAKARLFHVKHGRLEEETLCGVKHDRE